MRLNNRIQVTILAAGISIGNLCGCASHPQAAAPKVANPVIVTLVGRHQTITITSGPNAPLYTIVTADGQMVIANVTLADLRKLHPDVYEFYAPDLTATAMADSRDDSR